MKGDGWLLLKCTATQTHDSERLGLFSLMPTPTTSKEAAHQADQGGTGADRTRSQRFPVLRFPDTYYKQRLCTATLQLHTLCYQQLCRTAGIPKGSDSSQNTD